MSGCVTNIHTNEPIEWVIVSINSYGPYGGTVDSVDTYTDAKGFYELTYFASHDENLQVLYGHGHYVELAKTSSHPLKVKEKLELDIQLYEKAYVKFLVKNETGEVTAGGIRINLSVDGYSFGTDVFYPSIGEEAESCCRYVYANSNCEIHYWYQINSTTHEFYETISFPGLDTTEFFVSY